MYLIYRRGEITKADPVSVESLRKKKNVAFILNTEIKKINGKDLLEFIEIFNNKTNQSEILKLDGLFVEYGHKPNSQIAKKLGVETNDSGKIIVSSDMSTNLDCFFAAGDITNGSNEFDQATTAVAEGSIAANSAYQKIR